MTMRCAVFRLIFIGILATACAPDVAQHNNAGNRHFSESDYAGAIVEYRQAQVEAPDRPESYYNAANAYNRQGQLDPTIAQTQQALRTANGTLAAQSWYNLANAFFDAAAWAEAAAGYKEALRINPDDLDAKHNLELVLQMTEEQRQQAQGQPQDQEQQQENKERQQPDGGEEGEKGTPTPPPAAQPEQPQSEDQGSQEGQGMEGMAPQQALQLLEALTGDAETLQERLREMYRVPLPPPIQDW